MNYLPALIIMSSAVSLHAMERPNKRILYPPYQEESQYEPCAKKHEWQDPELLKHGIYVARVKNESGQPFQICNIPVTENREKGQRYSFIEQNGPPVIIEEIPKHNGILISKTGFIEPKSVSNGVSRAEGAYLLIRHAHNPEIHRVLWVLRQIDDEEHICIVASYFHDKPEAKYIEKNINPKNKDKKIITRVNVYLKDPELKDIKAITSTFVCS